MTPLIRLFLDNSECIPAGAWHSVKNIMSTLSAGEQMTIVTALEKEDIEATENNET